MIVKLTKEERKMLTALDPEGKGTREWMNARMISAVVFRKKEENLKQEEVRTIRNAFRKPLREELIEMAPDERGAYRITNRGRKINASGETSFDSIHERGDAMASAKTASDARKSKAPVKAKAKAPAKKAPVKKSAKAKAPIKKAPSKKAPVKKSAKAPVKKATTKAPKKAKAGMAPPKRPTKAPVKAEAKVPSNGSTKRPAFKRKNAPASFEANSAN